jgi:hypothetical protein
MAITAHHRLAAPRKNTMGTVPYSSGQGLELVKSLAGCGGGVNNYMLRPRGFWAVSGVPLLQPENWFVWSTTTAS